MNDVMNYSNSQNTREIGARLEPGAEARDVLRQGLTLALTGVSLGVAAALALTHLMKTFLFGVSATDLLIFAGTTVLTFIALAACWIPARRATNVDSLRTLRHE
jgi:ABC-type antimicrobial peptide transport system permease subunit